MVKLHLDQETHERRSAAISVLEKFLHDNGESGDYVFYETITCDGRIMLTAEAKSGRVACSDYKPRRAPQSHEF